MSRILVGGKSEQLAPLLSRIRTAAGLSRVAVGRPQLGLENPRTVRSCGRSSQARLSTLRHTQRWTKPNRNPNAHLPSIETGRNSLPRRPRDEPFRSSIFPPITCSTAESLPDIPKRFRESAQRVWVLEARAMHTRRHLCSGPPGFTAAMAIIS